MLRLVFCAAVLLSTAMRVRGELVTFNSLTAELSGGARLVFYNSVVGIPSPQFRVDFESGFADEQNVSGVTGLFPGGLVVREVFPFGSNLTPQAIIQQGPGSIDLSNPVGQFALTHTPREGSDLVLDFSASPVDYVAFADIDTDSINSLIEITFADNSTTISQPDDTLAVGDSAEFFGFFRNDRPPIRQLRFDFSGTTWGLDNIEYGVLPVLVPGDATGDGAVTFADFRILHANFGQPGGWFTGDFNSDGVVAFADFQILERNFSSSVPADGMTTVPEPAGCFWVVGLAIGLGRRRPSRKQKTPVGFTGVNAPSRT